MDKAICRLLRFALLAAMALPALLLAAAGAVTAARASDSAPPRAVLIDIEGPIGPATSDYVTRAHRKAVAGGASLIILRIDTPGGLDTSTRDIVKVVLASSIPVVVYVQPSGARAASAGTYILYAAHVAAMAPATSVGAATPVRLSGGTPFLPGSRPDDTDAGEDGKTPRGTGPDRAADRKATPPPEDASARKAVNDAVAFIRGLAEMRSRNPEWAERAVREGASLSSPEALKQGVADIVSDSLDDLLAKLDGRKVTTASGTVTLSTRGMQVERLVPDWRTRFLSIITSPTIAVILMMVGIYGLLFEGMNPGSILPGVVGGICLIIALFALQAMPISYAAAGLLLLGLVLLIAEALSPSFGVLGFGGIVALAIGSVMLVDTDVPGFGVNRGVIAGAALAFAGIMGFSVYLLGRLRNRRRPEAGLRPVGWPAEVTHFGNGKGWARLNGENWQITSDDPLQPGQQVTVTRVEGLILHVEPARQVTATPTPTSSHCT